MLNQQVATKVIDQGLVLGADFVDLFVEKKHRQTINYKSQKVNEISDGIDFGIGIRVIYGTKALYGYTNTTEEDELIRIIKFLCAQDQRVQASLNTNLIFNLLKINPYSKVLLGLDKVIKLEEKINLLKTFDQKTRSHSDKISQVDATSAEWLQEIQIFNSLGTYVEDSRSYTRFMLSAIATDGNLKSSANFSPGAHAGWEFSKMINPQMMAERVAKQALTTLYADPCPAGKMPVIIDNGFGGVIFHEACGHLLETTSVEKKASVFWDKMGEMIANPAVSAVDDGTIPNAWGSINVDDEGMPTQKTQLIKDGKLTAFLSDYLGEKKTGHKRTGSARRESYRFPPASRMRNTFIEAGPYTLEQLISSVDHGIYAKAMGGGSVNPGTGEFNFSVEEGYLVKNGKIEKAIKGATLIGTGPETLKKISMVANNFELMAGMCGSVSGSIPASVGQAALKVDEILVGGAA
jgi:TldD protein